MGFPQGLCHSNVKLTSNSLFGFLSNLSVIFLIHVLLSSDGQPTANENNYVLNLL